MKKITFSIAAILGALLLTTAVSASVLSPGLDIIAAEMDMTVSAGRGESIGFTEAQFASASGRESFQDIEITVLPASETGTLYFGDVCVAVGQVIEKESISKLRFEPVESVSAASFGFTIDDSYAMTCKLHFTENKNTAPTALSAVELCAFTGDTVAGEMRAHDPDGDSLFYEVVKYPSAGELLYDSKTGEFTYKAGSRVAEDSFTFKVKDSAGNYSSECRYTVSVTKNETDKVFCDMDNGSTPVSAAVMAEEGYMTFVEDGGKLYFSPDTRVSRLDFLVSAMDVFGAGNIPVVESTGFSDDSSIPDKYKGYVYGAAKLGIISDPETDGASAFRPYEPVTRAEASVILNSIIGYEAETVGSLSGVPAWAQADVGAMYELGVYDLKNGDAAATNALTKEEAADMLYKVYYLLGE